MKRIAMVVNNKERKDTTGTYFLEATRKYLDVGVEQYYLNEKIDTEYDAYMIFDCGLPINVEMYKTKKPLYYYAIDTHLGYAERLENAIAMDCKKVFLAQKNDVQKFIDAGVDAEWLPLGCDPTIHKPWYDGEKVYDVCAVMHCNNALDFMQRRIEYIDALFKEVPNFYFGQKYMREVTDIYAKSRIIFNIAVKNDVNMRVFEASCSGSLMITDEIKDNGLEDLGFKDGENIVIYKDKADMIEKAKYYLAHPEEADKISKAAQKLVMIQHTYGHRMKTILDRMSA